MICKDDYFKKISQRGSADGADGGLLDLLTWCDKIGLCTVTREEARRFWEDPNQPYRAEYDVVANKNSN